jgi:NADH-quinone oxidoreductase subunit J
MVELVVFVLAGAACLAGAIGVVVSRNPVHAALSLVGTLFGIAVLFVAQEANFLAAVQVIVYAGAIVVLFLFVIMLLGVDQADDLKVEPLVGQRVAAAIVGIAVIALPVAALASADFEATGVRGDFDHDVADIDQLGESLFGHYLYAFEITSLLLVIAARRTKRVDEIVDPGQTEEEARVAERIAKAEARARGIAYVPPREKPERAEEAEPQPEEVSS